MLYNLNTKSDFYDKDSCNQCQNDLLNLTEKYNLLCIENIGLKEENCLLNEKLDKLTNEIDKSTVEITNLKNEITDLNRKLNINSSNNANQKQKPLKL